MLTIKNFTKSYHSAVVISIAELHFSTGIHWLKGENGSGKTTFFKSLAGILPHHGDIFFDDGIHLKKNPIHFRKLVNYGEAEPIYPGFLTAKDLIAFTGKIKGATAQQQKSIIEQFTISSFLTKPCETYSSGMLKKLSLALAFLGQPRIIILDEPLITLDEPARIMLFTMMNSLIEKQKITFILSSHQAIENSSVEISGRYCVENKTILKLD